MVAPFENGYPYHHFTALSWQRRIPCKPVRGYVAIDLVWVPDLPVRLQRFRIFTGKSHAQKCIDRRKRSTGLYKDQAGSAEHKTRGVWTIARRTFICGTRRTTRERY